MSNLINKYLKSNVAIESEKKETTSLESLIEMYNQFNVLYTAFESLHQQKEYLSLIKENNLQNEGVSVGFSIAHESVCDMLKSHGFELNKNEVGYITSLENYASTGKLDILDGDIVSVENFIADLIERYKKKIGEKVKKIERFLTPIKQEYRKYITKLEKMSDEEFDARCKALKNNSQIHQYLDDNGKLIETYELMSVTRSSNNFLKKLTGLIRNLYNNVDENAIQLRYGTKEEYRIETNKAMKKFIATIGKSYKIGIYKINIKTIDPQDKKSFVKFTTEYKKDDNTGYKGDINVKRKDLIKFLKNSDLKRANEYIEDAELFGKLVEIMVKDGWNGNYIVQYFNAIVSVVNFSILLTTILLNIEMSYLMLADPDKKVEELLKNLK